MNQRPGHSVRRIVLPSGRAIEVVRFATEDGSARGLDICPHCECSLVQPVEWGETARGYWELVLYCPNCDWETEGIFHQEQVDEFEDRLDEGLAEMLADLRRLTAANMSEEIERFAAALQRDLLLPEDF
jgi:hypothetical protein